MRVVTNLNSHPQPPPHLFRRKPRDADHFISAVLASRDCYGRPWQIQKIREELDASLIGAAINRRRSQSNFQCASEFPDNRVSAGARLDLGREGDTGGGFMESDHVLYDKHSCSWLAQRALSSAVRAADS